MNKLVEKSREDTQSRIARNRRESSNERMACELMEILVRDLQGKVLYLQKAVKR